ncbi:MAG: PqqD family protein [Planctomycetaceae bacterium]|nr:PqqD family protein [Planctomycetaceae bacterium]
MIFASKSKRLPSHAGTAPFLRTVPRLNASLDVERRSSGKVVVEVPMEKPWYMVPPVTWVLPIPNGRRIELDALGAGVLDLCDGRRSVEKIIELFASGHKLTFREAQLSVTQFLRQLTRRGIVVLVGLKEDTDKP